MTIPKMAQRVSEMVRDMIPMWRHRLSPQECTLAIYLRGNIALYEALIGILRQRIEGRASIPVSSNPIECLASMARDREIQWVLSRLDFVFRSPATQPGETDSEPPA